MADAKGDLLDEHQSPQKLSKRKPDAAAAESKKPKPDTSPDPLLTQEEAGDAAQADHHKGEEANGEGEGEEEDVDDGVNSNGKAAVDKGKGVVTAVDKGKGKMAVEDEDEHGEDGDDSDDNDDDDSDDDSGDVVVGEDYESDFADDPLAEVDLSNILPSRTRCRDPPPPGAYLVNDLDGDDEDDDDEEICD